MKQLLQSYRSGEVWLAEVPPPTAGGRAVGAVVRNAVSLVSAGTERMIMELAKKSLLGKARARPDLVRKVIAKIKSEGLGAALSKAFAKLDTPIPLGYSCAGTIVEVGGPRADGRGQKEGERSEGRGQRAEESSSPDSSLIPHPSSFPPGLRPGDRVACGGAGYATHAEYNYVPTNLMAKIPAGVSFEDAAFTTVGAIAMQGVRQADVRLGERVVVIGLGLVGLLTVQILQAAGCAVLGSDPDEHKCDLARTFGAQAVGSGGAADLTAAAAGFSDGYGVDAVIITAATESNQPIESAAEVLRHKGRVVIVGVVGMEVPREPFYKKELDLRLSMSYGPGRYDSEYEEGGRDYPIGYVRWTEQRNMSAFLDLVAAEKVTPGKLVSHRFEIDEALKAYELLESGSEPYLGIVIDYPSSTQRDEGGRMKDESGEASVRIPHPPDSSFILHPSSSPAQPASSFPSIGLIGAGNFARGVIIPTLQKIGGIEMVGVCAATGASAAQAAKRYGFGYATTNYQKLLDDSRVNVIVIATRHALHAQLVCAAIEAGKHVLVEKPLCTRPEELEDIQRTIVANPGRSLMVGFNRRFSAHTQAVREAFVSRGAPMVITYRVNAGMVPKDSWIHEDGGRIVGEMCHFVDWCEYITGSAPVSVQAECVGSGDVRWRGEENVIATIRYEDGSVATIQYIAIGPTQLPKERVEVFADGKVAVLDDFTSTSFPGQPRPSLRTRQDKGFIGEWSAFLKTVREGGAMPIPFASMARTSQVTFAITDALASGKPVHPNASVAEDTQDRVRESGNPMADQQATMTNEVPIPARGE